MNAEIHWNKRRPRPRGGFLTWNAWSALAAGAVAAGMLAILVWALG